MKQMWNERLSAARAAWRELRPSEPITRKRTTKMEFWFKSVRPLAAGVEFWSMITGWELRNETWSIRVRGALSDYRVAALWSFAEGRAMGDLYFLDFDVLAAFAVLEGEPVPPSPLLANNHGDADIENVLRDYSRKIDRIWNSFGGYTLRNFESLAVWAMQQGEHVGSQSADVSVACAAFTYGERERSFQYMKDYRAHWERLLQADPGHEAVRAGVAHVRETLTRLESFLESKLPRVH